MRHLRNRLSSVSRADARAHAPVLPPVPLGAARARLFTDGRALAAEMLAAIEAARDTIYFETFLWGDDGPGRRFKQALVERAAAGVQVYVIFDRLGNTFYSSREFKRFPDLPTLHVLDYRSLAHPWHLLDLRRIARDHRKLLIVDGERGFVGGYNISAQWLAWRDTHLELRGAPVADLAAAFVAFWNRERAGLPRLEPPERRWEPAVRVHVNDVRALAFPIRALYLAAVERARRRLWLTTAYFTPDRALLQALSRAAARGVDVRVLLPWRSEHLSADLISRRRFGALLAPGVRIFAYRGPILHAKTLTADGEWSTVGTANLDRLSLLGNHEINVELFSPGLAAQLEAVFLRDCERAPEIVAADWARRGALERLAELAAMPLWPFV